MLSVALSLAEASMVEWERRQSHSLCRRRFRRCSGSGRGAASTQLIPCCLLHRSISGWHETIRIDHARAVRNDLGLRRCFSRANCPQLGATTRWALGMFRRRSIPRRGGRAQLVGSCEHHRWIEQGGEAGRERNYSQLDAQVRRRRQRCVREVLSAAKRPDSIRIEHRAGAHTPVA